MGHRWNRLVEPIFMAVPKPMRTEFGIHLRLESCGVDHTFFAKIVGLVPINLLLLNRIESSTSILPLPQCKPV